MVFQRLDTKFIKNHAKYLAKYLLKKFDYWNFIDNFVVGSISMLTYDSRVERS